MGAYAPPGKLSKNDWITDPRIPDPDNLPVPLGYNLLVRPYPIVQNTDNSVFTLPDVEIDHMNHVTNIARVVAIGACAWNNRQYYNRSGEQFNWVDVGDFIAFPKNIGGKRTFKGVSYIMLTDDEVNEFLPDPQVFDDAFFKVDIPEDHLVKYNTIKNPNYKGK